MLEPSKVFQGILTKILESAGVECRCFSDVDAAINARHGYYTFIIISRSAGQSTGEEFLARYKEKFGFGNSLTILLLSETTDSEYTAANQAGFKLVFDKKKLVALQDIVHSVIKKRSLEHTASILLVEDSIAVANAISEQFRQLGTLVRHGSTVTEAKEIFNTFDIDLVISDYHLADQETGYDIINIVRQDTNPAKSQTPILIISADTDKLARVSLLTQGANDFILKPYDQAELLVRSTNLIKAHALLQKVSQQRDDLEKMAMVDQLTNLYNRHSFYDMAPKMISLSRRNNMSLCLLVIDLDHFKNINDSYGHSTGDIVLKTVASILQNNSRLEDALARYGGEEFISLMPNCSQSGAFDVAERIRVAISKSDPEGLTITASIGVAQLKSNETFEELFVRADKNLYKAKSKGRNCIVTE
ncbi:diguanylate cyclase [Gilvimarinus sp. SDUM040013]|uniref:GGDEF domain-containing response regulator n=1 Tax=Gilvimarinus gilvus TaxID=3058038 RepID=UPI0026738F78|nr:diguanylate cyclase [Gilvimarinus sp. SDUM040013]MDO3388734.1 diguanylate cyclase [Gilvimarinus sp. SDUM040013]